MAKRYVYGSLARISDLETVPFTVHPLKRDYWETGDYVVGRMITAKPGTSDTVELTTGRFAHLMKGDQMVGALGVRASTLEVVGNWKLIGSDGRMDDLTGAGLFGLETSKSKTVPHSPSFEYQGHVLRRGEKVCMKDFVPDTQFEEVPYCCPTILLLGTSMSSGKTTAGRQVIHLLKELGVQRIVATKLSGAGFYHDILSFHDAGADLVYDFVDAGLPSSIISQEVYRSSMRNLLSIISAQNPDIVVAEAGASPFEPYNGFIALQELYKGVKFIVMCASDPYAVVAMTKDFGIRPNVVSGIVTSNSAGIDLVQKLSGIPALSLCDENSLQELAQYLRKIFNLPEMC
jgi:hypothetical protein